MSKKHTFGVYAYALKATGRVVYIGSDSNIDRNQRHREHFQEAKAVKLKFNGWAQEHKDEIQYMILATFLLKEHMLKFEREAINEYEPEQNVKRKRS